MSLLPTAMRDIDPIPTELGKKIERREPKLTYARKINEGVYELNGKFVTDIPTPDLPVPDIVPDALVWVEALKAKEEPLVPPGWIRGVPETDGDYMTRDSGIWYSTRVRLFRRGVWYHTHEALIAGKPVWFPEGLEYLPC